MAGEIKPQQTTGLVPDTRTVNGQALSGNVTLSASDVVAGAQRELIWLVAAPQTVAGDAGTLETGQQFVNPARIYSGKSIRLVVTIRTNDATKTVTAALYNVTNAEYVTGASVTHTGSTSYTQKTSGALTVGHAAGDFRDTSGFCYAVHLSITGGTAAELGTVTSAYLEIY